MDVIHLSHLLLQLTDLGRRMIWVSSLLHLVQVVNVLRLKLYAPDINHINLLTGHLLKFFLLNFQLSLKGYNLILLLLTGGPKNAEHLPQLIALFSFLFGGLLALTIELFLHLLHLSCVLLLHVSDLLVRKLSCLIHLLQPLFGNLLACLRVDNPF